MSGLRYPGGKTQEEKFEDAIKYIDALFPYFPDYADFDICGLVNKVTQDTTERKDIIGCQNQIKQILEQHKYIKQGTFSSKSQLNEEGRAAKAAGGHFAYLHKKQQNRMINESTLLSYFYKQNKEITLDELFAKYGAMDSILLK